MKSVLFADDTTLFTTNTNIENLSTVISNDLQRVNEWLTVNSLTLNIRKTYYIIFSNREVPNNLQIKLGQHTLERQNSGKFLGVILDEKLSFKEHIATTTNKVSKIVGLFYKLKKSFPLEIIYRLYYALIYPHLTYCLLAWGSAKPAYLHPLIMLQKRVARIVTDSHYYAHSLPLFKRINMLKIDDMHMLACQIFAFETLVLDKYPVSKEKILNLQIQHTYETRHTYLRNIYCRISLCKQSLTYNIIKAWNVLHEDVKKLTSLCMFKNTCKKVLIEKYC